MPLGSTVVALTTAKVALEVASQVAKLVKEIWRGDDSDTNNVALTATIEEWEHVASAANPRVASQLSNPHQQLFSVGERADHLVRIVKEYAEDTGSATARFDSSSINLRHTSIAPENDGAVRVLLGASSETCALQGYETAEGDEVTSMTDLPIFRVTMLGGSGTGKTVFMAMMYAKLREGERSIAIHALQDRVDLELGHIVENLYRLNKWPPGTEDMNKGYDFDLQLNGQPVAYIDWVDYRGGALYDDPESAAGQALTQRLRESHAIIWMVDMSVLKTCARNSLKARVMTHVGRMSHSSRHAVAKSPDQPRAWLFIRTKADTVRGADGMPDWKRATDELLEHLGPTVSVATSGRYSRAAALSISSTGRIENQELLGDDPHLAEWPLLLALAFLMDAEATRVGMLQDEMIRSIRQDQTGLARRLRTLLSIGSSAEQQRASAQLGDVTTRLRLLRNDIAQLMAHCPQDVLPVGK